MRSSLLLFFIVLSLFSCTEKETIYVNEHDNQVIDNNTAPPYNGVTTLQIQNYINKTYIDLLGREPEEDELNIQTNQLKNLGLGIEARENLVNSLFITDEYYPRFFDKYRGSYLNGVLQQQIEETVVVLQNFYDYYISLGDPISLAIAASLELELERMDDLSNAPEDYQNGVININQFIQRMIYNAVYDEINMGSDNFVIAAFNNLYKRNPTDAELFNGVNIVNGEPGTLLLQDGTNKADFVDIITSTLEFYEGITFDIYNDLLARNPSSPEMDQATSFLDESQNYQELQMSVISSEEYAGF